MNFTIDLQLCPLKIPKNNGQHRNKEYSSYPDCGLEKKFSLKWNTIIGKSRSGAENVQDEPVTSCHNKNKGAIIILLGNISKGLGSQIEKLHMSEKDNFSIHKNNNYHESKYISQVDHSES